MSKKDKFYNRVDVKVSSKLKKIYPNGYGKGVEVLVPLNSVASVEALIDSHEYSGGYQVRGNNSFDPWRRWVRTTHIRPTEMYDFIETYCIEDYNDREEIIKRVMEIISK